MALISFRNVTKVFGRDATVTALDGIDLDVRRGEFVAIEGPSGSGKSTLLNILTLLDTPTAGQYVVADSDTLKQSRRSIARLRSREFGFVFQSFHLMLRRDAIENVGLGLLYRGVRKRERERRARAALEQVGLGHRMHTPCAKLSGGERQRVAIARAIVASPEILVADEPTGSLDSATGTLIVEELERIHQSGKTVVMVTHDRDVAAKAGRRILLRDGRIVSDSLTAAGPDMPPPSSVAEAPSTTGKPSTIRAGDLLRESWRALISRPGRFAILIAAVGLAVALVVITAGLSTTASAQVDDTFNARLNREVTVSLPTDSIRLPISPEETERAARSVAGVDEAGVAQTIDSVAVAKSGASSGGIDAEGYLITSGLVRAADASVRWAPGHAPELGPREILVGRLLAQDLELSPIDLDPQVEISGNLFGVAGIVRSGGRLPDMLNAVVANSSEASLLGSARQTKVLLTTRQGAAQQVAQQIPVALDPVRPESATVTAPVDPSTLKAEVTGEVRSVLLALSLVALLASILGVANSMLLGVLERVGELGLRRAIGARALHILAQSGLESVMVGLAGGLVGMVVGLLTVLGVTIVNGWAPVVDLRVAPIALLGGAVVGIFGGLPASVRASRINPADALRR